MRGNNKASASADAPVAIWILPRNRLTVERYCRCQITRVGMVGHCTGISALEARAAVRNDPVESQDQLIDDIQLMGRAASEYLNEQAEEARRKTK